MRIQYKTTNNLQANSQSWMARAVCSSSHTSLIWLCFHEHTSYSLGIALSWEGISLLAASSVSNQVLLLIICASHWIPLECYVYVNRTPLLSSYRMKVLSGRLSLRTQDKLWPLKERQLRLFFFFFKKIGQRYMYIQNCSKGRVYLIQFSCKNNHINNLNLSKDPISVFAESKSLSI